MKTVQREKRVVCCEPKDLSGGAVNGPWISMQNYQHATIYIACGDVGADFTIELEQASDLSGTGAKTLALTEIYQADNSASTVTDRDKFAAVAVTSDTHTVANATDDSFHHLIELDSASLDRDNDFSAFRLALSDAGSTATYVFAVAEMKEANFAGQEDSTGILPSALG